MCSAAPRVVVGLIESTPEWSGSTTSIRGSRQSPSQQHFQSSRDKGKAWSKILSFSQSIGEELTRRSNSITE